VRGWLLAYGVIYVAIEMVGQSLTSVGWPRITALDVATAVVDAFLTVAVALAVLLALHLAARRWGQLPAAEAGTGEPAEPIRAAPLGVRSWRAEPSALPSAAQPPPRPVRGTYAVGAYGSERRSGRVAPAFPEEPGALL
jgi:hypothetical protein